MTKPKISINVFYHMNGLQKKTHDYLNRQREAFDKAQHSTMALKKS